MAYSKLALAGGGGSYGNAFPARVAPTPMPNVFSDLASVYPNLTGTNAAVSGAIQSQLAGNLFTPPYWNAAAETATASGMPGSAAIPGSFENNRYLGNVAGAREAQVQRGIQNYNATLPTVSHTQTVNPALQADINSQNAINRAAPDAQAQQSYAEQLFEKYLKLMRGPQGGTGLFAPEQNNGPVLPPIAGSGFGGPKFSGSTNQFGEKISNPFLDYGNTGSLGPGATGGNGLWYEGGILNGNGLRGSTPNPAPSLPPAYGGPTPGVQQPQGPQTVFDWNYKPYDPLDSFWENALW